MNVTSDRAESGAAARPGHAQAARLRRLRAPGRGLHTEIINGHERGYEWLLFRSFQLGEFLEARIVPERIEHRIEPEQRRSERDA